MIQQLKSIRITENKKLEIFKRLLQTNDKDMRKSLLKYCSFIGMKSSDLLKMDIQYKYVKKHQNDLLNNKQIYNKEIELYNEVLEKLVLLAQELNLEGSLDYCNLFTYLLWNGYLSENKKLFFDIKKTKSLDGVHFIDIMHGYTTCLNNSMFLRDFLNKANYSSITLENRYDKIFKEFVPKIKRHQKIYIFTYLANKLMENTINYSAENHAFNLVGENDSLYIYDSTNLAVFRIDNNKKASIINGNGNSLLAPIPSYAYIDNERDEIFLDRFMKYKGSCPYDSETLKNSWNVTYELFLNNNLLGDFYNDIHPKVYEITQSKKVSRKYK